MDGWERRGVSVERRDGDAGAVAVVAMMSWGGGGNWSGGGQHGGLEVVEVEIILADGEGWPVPRVI